MWGDRIPDEDVSRSAIERRIHERVEAFRTWAETRDRSLEPWFTTETVHSKITTNDIDGSSSR